VHMGGKWEYTGGVWVLEAKESYNISKRDQA
jgi:hypothetical protein